MNVMNASPLTDRSITRTICFAFCIVTASYANSILATAETTTQFPHLVFDLSSPASGATGLRLDELELKWTAASAAKGYLVQIGTDRDFSQPIIVAEKVTRTSFQVPIGKVLPDKKYYWRVFVECDPATGNCPGGENLVPARNGPFDFTAQRLPKPKFFLSEPVSKSTNKSLDKLGLTWTTDKAKGVKSYKVKVGTDANLGQPLVLEKVVDADPTPDSNQQSFPIPKKPGKDESLLERDRKYYWTVVATCDARLAECSEGELLNPTTETKHGPPPHWFKTEAAPFESLEKKGLTLQRAVAGKDSTEGAQIAFLRTVGGDTVFTADFALIWQSPSLMTNCTFCVSALQTSVEGKLTSKESQAEDAWRLRGGFTVDWLPVATEPKNSFTFFLGAKYETSQDFDDTRKFMSENVITFTSVKLGMGHRIGSISKPFAFRWRPFFGVDVGHTIKKGKSMETSDTLVRLVPRVRAQLYFNWLSQALNLSSAFLFVDETFYFLPPEEGARKHNFFTSGLVLEMNKTFGFSLTYKVGAEAPKFERVHTFGGAFTVRFGKLQ